MITRVPSELTPSSSQYHDNEAIDGNAARASEGCIVWHRVDDKTLLLIIGPAQKEESTMHHSHWGKHTKARRQTHSLLMGLSDIIYDTGKKYHG